MPASPALAAPRRPEGRARRRSPWRALLAASLAVVAAGQAPADAATPPFSIDVDGQTAVFQLTELKPGPVGSRCLLLSIANGSADEVLLSATVGGTGLAAYLDVLVEVGTSADPATCTDFTGTGEFAGTLADLGSQHGTPGTGVVLPLTANEAVVRFTLSLQSDNDAQGRTATATFRFDATDTTGLPPTTTTTPTTAAPTTAPTTTSATAPTTAPGTTSAPPVTEPPDGSTTPTAPRSPTTGPRATSTTVAAPSTSAATTTTSTTQAPTTSTGTPAAGPSIPGRAGTGGTGSDAADDADDADAGTATPTPADAPRVVVTDPTVEPEPEPLVARAVEVVAETATTAAKTSSVPAGFLSVVFLFLVVQDRFDRNDPKLAHAPLAPEPEMVFQPRHGRLRP